MTSLRILIYGINFWPEPIGVGKYTGELSEALGAAGHEVRVVTAPPYYPNWQVRHEYRRPWYRSETSSPSIRIIRCPLWVPSNPTGLTRLLHLLSFALSSLPVVLSQRLWRPDTVIVVVPTLFCVPGALLASIGSRAKRLVHVQDLEVDAAFELGIVRSGFVWSLVLRAERWLLSRFDVVSSVSSRMLARLASKGIPERKLVLLPNWIHTEQIRPGSSTTDFRFEWGLEQESVVALYSGSIGEKQGLEVLLEAGSRLEDDSSIRFVVCSEGPTFERLKKKYARLSNVLWRDLVPPEKLNDLLNTADMHLLPQRADAGDLVMPSKLTGMLASGRPIVATAAAGTEIALVVEGRGIVVPPGDVEAMEKAIRQLSGDADLRRRLGAAARRYAEEHLAKDAILGRFEADLQRLTRHP
jgi:colanic acid biosynthesis glycosyl transferase WcaI